MAGKKEETVGKKPKAAPTQGEAGAEPQDATEVVQEKPMKAPTKAPVAAGGRYVKGDVFTTKMTDPPVDYCNACNHPHGHTQFTECQACGNAGK